MTLSVKSAVTSKRGGLIVPLITVAGKFVANFLVLFAIIVWGELPVIGAFFEGLPPPSIDRLFEAVGQQQRRAHPTQFSTVLFLARRLFFFANITDFWFVFYVSL